MLHKEGFELNPYDCCVANKMISGKQFTIGWYIDDNILSYVDSNVVLNTIERYFPGLSIGRGKQSNFLGMELDFFEPGKVKIGTI